MIKQTIKILKNKKLKIAFAESVTGGLLSSLFTDYAGVSSIFDFGVICYSNKMKEKILKISLETLNNYGVVSKEVSKQMALAVKKIANSDIAVGITGSAGPTSLGGSVVGQVWFTIVYLDKILSYEFIFKDKSRIDVKKDAANKVFKELYQLLKI